MIRPLINWARACYLNQSLSRPRNPTSTLHEVLRIQATSFVEESIWSAGLGLKGQIDASLRVQPLHPSLLAACCPEEGQVSDDALNRPACDSVLIPFELKTGRRSKSLELLHKAQVRL